MSQKSNDKKMCSKAEVDELASKYALLHSMQVPRFVIMMESEEEAPYPHQTFTMHGDPSNNTYTRTRIMWCPICRRAGFEKPVELSNRMRMNHNLKYYGSPSRVIAKPVPSMLRAAI